MLLHGEMTGVMLAMSVCLLLLARTACTYSQDFHKQITVNDTSIRLLAVGDWGGLPLYPYVTPVETHVAKGMGSVSEKQRAHFVLALGDNFYYHGVKSAHDSRFKETYESVFTNPSLYIPWYVLAGNHDHYGNVSAQIEYTTLSKRWKFPDYYYGLQFKTKEILLEILMLDTVLLCGNTEADSKGDQPMGPLDKEVSETQWQWLEEKLRKSRADYLLVAGHFPVWSAAWHGPTKCLVSRLKPQLHKYRVSAYLCGHDHDLQHLRTREMNHTVDYILSGAAQLLDPFLFHKKDVPPGSLKFQWSNILGKGGFAYLEVRQEKMVFSFWDSTSTKLYENSLKPRTAS